ncbi:MAG: hypothetical protein HC868_06225 [Sphingomonadales bacterium]|nr:hypothetical protein [Sphingomonadales bacterium]
MADKQHAAEQLALLLARVALGDRSSFANLYAATRRELLAVAFRVLGSRDTAEEALQEAFVSVWHHAGNYRAAAKPTDDLDDFDRAKQSVGISTDPRASTRGARRHGRADTGRRARRRADRPHRPAHVRGSSGRYPCRTQGHDQTDL